MMRSTPLLHWLVVSLFMPLAVSVAGAQGPPLAARQAAEVATEGSQETAGEAAPAAEPTPLSIHIFGETKDELDKAERNRVKKRLAQARSVAKDALKAIEKELKARYGKRSSEWPEDASARYREADSRERLATLEYHLVEMKPSEVPDSVENLKAAMEDLIDSDFVKEMPVAPRLVESREQADIAIQVLTRRSRMGPAWYLYLKVLPQDWLEPAKLSEASLEKATRIGNSIGVVRTLTPYGAEGPYWIVEVERAGGALGWKGVAGLAVQSLVELFGEIAHGKAEEDADAPAGT
jgi:hypothetical protein